MQPIGVLSDDNDAVHKWSLRFLNGQLGTIQRVFEEMKLKFMVESYEHTHTHT